MHKTPQDMIKDTIHETINHGPLRVVHYTDNAAVLIEFIRTKFRTTSSAGPIRKGQVKDKLLPCVFSIGFLGDGCHSRKTNIKMYDTWYNMLRRVYDERLRHKHPTYKDCSVAIEWHNFQNFAVWYEVHYKEDFQLDKDIKVKGNKVYGPDTCMFVSRTDNNIEANAKTAILKSPSGEIVEVYNIKEFSLKMGLLQSEMSRVSNGKAKSHKGWTKAP